MNKIEWDFQEDKIMLGAELTRAIRYNYWDAEMACQLKRSIEMYFGYNNHYNGEITPSLHCREEFMSRKGSLVGADGQAYCPNSLI